MIKVSRRSSFLRPLLVTALPFGLLSAGAMSAHAGSVTATGANGVIVVRNSVLHGTSRFSTGARRKEN